MATKTTRKTAFPLLSPPDPALNECVARERLIQPEALTTLGRLVTADREGEVADVSPCSEGSLFHSFYLAPADKLTELGEFPAYVGDGLWRDGSTGAEFRATAQFFAVALQLGTLDPDDDCLNGNGIPVVLLTDVDLTEADVEVFRQKGVTLARLGDGYQKALQARLDVLRSPLAVLPTV